MGFGVLSVAILGGGGPFKRWSLVGSPKITVDVPQEGLRLAAWEPELSSQHSCEKLGLVPG